VAEPFPPKGSASADRLLNPCRDMQEMSGLPMTGRFDRATNDMMNAPRCGMMDKPMITDDSMAPDNYVLHGKTLKVSRLSSA